MATSCVFYDVFRQTGRILLVASPSTRPSHRSVDSKHEDNGFIRSSASLGEFQQLGRCSRTWRSKGRTPDVTPKRTSPAAANRIVRSVATQLMPLRLLRFVRFGAASSQDGYYSRDATTAAPSMPPMQASSSLSAAAAAAAAAASVANGQWIDSGSQQ